VLGGGRPPTDPQAKAELLRRLHRPQAAPVPAPGEPPLLLRVRTAQLSAVGRHALEVLLREAAVAAEPLRSGPAAAARGQGRPEPAPRRRTGVPA
jgi:hypothetical protein